jgi:hypothetical protein
MNKQFMKIQFLFLRTHEDTIFIIMFNFKYLYIIESIFNYYNLATVFMHFDSH